MDDECRLSDVGVLCTLWQELGPIETDCCVSCMVIVMERSELPIHTTSQDASVWSFSVSVSDTTLVILEKPTSRGERKEVKEPSHELESLIQPWDA